MSEKGRPPDYKIGALNKRTGQKSPKVGAAWKNDDGTISIRLDALVVLYGSTDFVLTLFKNDPNSSGSKRGGGDHRPVSADDDDLPF